MSEDFLMAVKNYSEKEIRAALSRISSEDLEKHLNSFIAFQGKGCTSRALARKWAFSVEIKHLGPRLESFIEHQYSNDEDVRALARDLADKIDEEVLIENIFLLIDYQGSDDEDVRTLTSDLALKINPDKLIDKLDLIDKICQESKDQYVCALAAKLVENIQGGTDEDNIQAIIDLVVY